MKKALLILTAAAGMLLLGGASAKADDGTTLELKATTGGTFTASYVSSSYYYKWESTTEPVITILDGTSNNNMQATNTDDFVMYEGQSNMTHDYTVSVADGYVITGMSVTVTTTVEDMTVTVGTVSNTLTANTAANYEMSGLWRQSVGITITSSTTGNEGATFSNWKVTVQEDIDLSKMKITSIGEAITTLPVEGTWYLIENEKGGYTPAGDTGEGQSITRASSADVVKVGDFVMDVMEYMLGFHPTALVSSTGVGNVCNLQFATGNYWVSAYGYSQAQTIATTSSLESAGNYNVYLTQTGGTTFALNAYDMEKKVDNNGAGGAVVGWDSGQNTSTSGNNVWVLYPLELEQAEDTEVEEHEHEEILEALIEEAQAAYNANEGSYDTDIEFGFTDNNGVGNGIIKETSQFSSPYTSNAEGSLDNLLDNDASTYWHSDWSAEVANGTHYIEVDLSDTYLSGEDAFTGGPLLVDILRRSGANNDHVTKMSVKDGSDTWIADLSLPFGSAGERVMAGFICPEDVYTLRFYEEETYGTQNGMNRGYFHLGDFQLFYTTCTEDYNEGLQEAEELAAAIAAAQAILDAALEGSSEGVSEENIAALQAALDAYNAVFAAHNALAAELQEVIEKAQATHDNYDGGYGMNVETGFSEGNGIGNGLIRQNAQFSSPYTEATEGSLDYLLDNDASTFWHSAWSDGSGNAISVTDGTHYIEVDLGETYLSGEDAFVGGPMLVNILRRANSTSDHITKMSVKDGSDNKIADLDLPDDGAGTRVIAAFTCPYGVKTLRFYEEETSGYQGGDSRGYFHLGDFQLFYTNIYPDLNTTYTNASNALLSAIAEAKAMDDYYVTEDDIETLQTAIQTYLTALSEYTVSWTLGADYGTLILPFEADVPSGLTAYTTSGVSDDELQLASVGEGGKLSANTPYIISGTASTTPYTFTGLPAMTGSLTDGYLVGTYESLTAPAGSYVLQNQTGTPAFYLVNSEDITVGAYHCYLTLPDAGGNAKAVVYFPGSGVATAIEAVETAAETGSEAIYDLSGRKVTNPRSGIYIKGGKKVIIK